MLRRRKGEAAYAPELLKLICGNADQACEIAAFDDGMRVLPTRALIEEGRGHSCPPSPYTGAGRENVLCRVSPAIFCAQSEPRCGHAVDHGPVAQHRQVEAVAVEGDELRV